jgi:hypothetical protein
VLLELLKKAFGQIRDRHAFPLCPMKQMLCCSDVPAGGYLCIACVTEFFGKPFKQRACRSSAECFNSLMAAEKML